MNKQLEALTKHVMQQQQPQVQQATTLRCDFCGERHANSECVREGLSDETNYMGNYQRGNRYSNTYNPGYPRHPNPSYSNTNTLNPLLPNPQPQQQQHHQRKPSAFEEAMTNFVKMTQTNLEEIKASQEAERKNNEAARKMFETQIGQIAKQLADQAKGGFIGNTKDNPKNESCNAIDLRSKKVLTPLVPKAIKKSEEVVLTDTEIGVVEKNSEEVVVEKENDNGVVENERKKKNDEREKSEPLIDVDSMLRKSKNQLLQDGNKKQKFPSYVKLSLTPIFPKRRETRGVV